MRAAPSRVALVTGGARGIGAAISRRLAAAGHRVVVNYSSSAEPAKLLAEDIRAAGGTAETVQADVSDPAAVEAMVERAGEIYGPPTILVNNAGVSAPSSAVKQTPEQWDRLIAVNLSGAFYCTHAALPGMYAEGWGRVILLGSPGGGRTVTAGMSAYAAAKAGLVAMGKVIAQETARRGITVNTVVPGFVETDMVTGAGDGMADRMARTWPRIPAGAVADTVAFLVSEDAAYVSGEEVGVWLGGPVPIGRPAGAR